MVDLPSRDSQGNGYSKNSPWQKMTKVFGARTAKEHAAHLLPHLRSDSRILDIGCGLGSITLDFARLTAGEVVGLDVNPETTDAARETAMMEGIANVSFVDGDAHDLSRFESESFDIVHAHQVVLYLHSPTRALAEMRRVLKTGGVLAIRDNVQFVNFPHNDMIEKNRAWFTELVKKRGGTPDAGLHSHMWMHEAGFAWEQITTSVASWEYSRPEERQNWADGAKNSFRAAGLANGLGTPREYDQVQQAYEEWAKKDEGRFIGLDGVVLAQK